MSTKLIPQTSLVQYLSAAASQINRIPDSPDYKA